MIDAAHDHVPIVEAVNGRRVRAIVLTHGHNDHINVAVTLRDAVDAPIHLHADDRMLWDVVWPGEVPDVDTEPGATIAAGGHELVVLHTPGHSPGLLLLPRRATSGVVFSGDTLFCGGPGATGRSFSDEPTILRSIRDLLLIVARRDDRAHGPRRVDYRRRRAIRRHRPSSRTRCLNGFHPRPVTHLCNQSLESSSTTPWGDREFIPDLLGCPPDGLPWAELWLGTHPGGPSVLGTRSGGQPLSDVTGPLPYLLKVLAAAEPLSLQTHPNADQAKAGYQVRRYPDPYPKPELLCALTRFEAFCGVRPLDETAAFLEELDTPEARGVGVGDRARRRRRRGRRSAAPATAVPRHRRRLRRQRPPRGAVGDAARRALPGRPERRRDAAAQLRPARSG